MVRRKYYYYYYEILKISFSNVFWYKKHKDLRGRARQCLERHIFLTDRSNWQLRSNGHRTKQIDNTHWQYFLRCRLPRLTESISISSISCNRTNYDPQLTYYSISSSQLMSNMKYQVLRRNQPYESQGRGQNVSQNIE